MAGFASAVSQDVPPFMTVDGNPLAVRGFNIEGLRRRGFRPERMAAVKQMHRLLYRQGKTWSRRASTLPRWPPRCRKRPATLRLMTGFLSQATRGIVALEPSHASA